MMKILNIHERLLPVSVSKTAKLIDNLASANEQLWPRDRWPAMQFDRPLEVGANGGHGPIRYRIEYYRPGEIISFQFTSPKGFIGGHRFEIVPVSEDQACLRHVVEMRLSGNAWLIWSLAIRWLHDALIEDALDRAEIFAGGQPVKREWSIWVRFLRKLLRRNVKRNYHA